MMKSLQASPHSILSDIRKSVQSSVTVRTPVFAISLVVAACGSSAGDDEPDDANILDVSSIDAAPFTDAVDAPTDAQIWPPTDFGITVSAAAVADFDGDGREDLLLAIDNGHRGLHVFRGGVDLDDHGAVIDAPDHAELLLGAVAALALYDGLAVIVHDGGPPTMAVFDTDLTLYSTSNGIPTFPPTDYVGLAPLPIGAQGSLGIATSTELRYLERDELRLNPPTVTTLSQPSSPFMDIRAFASDPSGTLVVAERSRVSLGAPPAASGGAHTWTQRPLAGAPWANVIVGNVTNDARPDVIGYRKPAGGSAEICVHDGADSPGVQPTCKVLTGQLAEFGLLLHAELDPSPGRDLIVAMARQGYFIDAYPDLHVDVAGVRSGPRRTLNLERWPDHLVTMDVDGDGDRELILINQFGHIQCLALTSAAFGSC
ncbi:MAG: hypothetical protein F9K40_08825 [Kofleriaceae bacterium]|nr:MAG: hypothetical protein F9K40_08825 [Kofleriaceae bacterium]MBZ0235967.1 hypothetical protein [Kofleriaceae bacterium]